MGKVSTVSISAVSVLVAAGLLIPGYVGKIVEKNAKSTVAQLTKGWPAPLKVQSVQRHWFTSTVTLKGPTGDLIPLTLYHGPVTFAAGFPQFSLVSLRGEFPIEPKVKAKLSGQVSYGGHLTVTAALPKDYAFGMHSKLKVGESSIRLYLPKHAQNTQMHVAFSDVNFQDSHIKGHINQIGLELGHDFSHKGVYSIKSFSINGSKVSSGNKQIVSVNRLLIRNLRLDIPALIQAKFGFDQTTPKTDIKKERDVVLHLMKKIIEPGTLIQLDQGNIHSPVGQFSVNARYAVDQSYSKDAANLTAELSRHAQLDLSIDSKKVELRDRLKPGYVDNLHIKLNTHAPNQDGQSGLVSVAAKEVKVSGNDVSFKDPFIRYETKWKDDDSISMNFIHRYSSLCLGKECLPGSSLSFEFGPLLGYEKLMQDGGASDLSKLSKMIGAQTKMTSALNANTPMGLVTWKLNVNWADSGNGFASNNLKERLKSIQSPTIDLTLGLPPMLYQMIVAEAQKTPKIQAILSMMAITKTGNRVTAVFKHKGPIAPLFQKLESAGNNKPALDPNAPVGSQVDSPVDNQDDPSI